MVVAELTLTLVLLAGAGLMIRSFLKLYSMELGVETAHVLTMRTTLPPAATRRRKSGSSSIDALLARLGAVPGVSAVATATRLPLEGGGRPTASRFEGRPAPDPKTGPRGAFVLSSARAISTRCPFRFDAGGSCAIRTARPASETVVVSERFVARFFPGEDALGKRFRNRTDPARNDANPWLTIVGCRADASGRRILRTPIPIRWRISRSGSDRPASTAIARAGGRNADVDHVAVREAIQEVDQDQPMFDLKTLDEELATQQLAVPCLRIDVRDLRADRAGAVCGRHLRGHVVRRDAAHIGDRRPHGAGRAAATGVLADPQERLLASSRSGSRSACSEAWGVTFVLQSLARADLADRSGDVRGDCQSALGRHARRVHHPGAESDAAGSAASTQQELTVRIQESESQNFNFGAASRRRL